MFRAWEWRSLGQDNGFENGLCPALIALILRLAPRLKPPARSPAVILDTGSSFHIFTPLFTFASSPTLSLPVLVFPAASVLRFARGAFDCFWLFLKLRRSLHKPNCSGTRDSNDPRPPQGIKAIFESFC